MDIRKVKKLIELLEESDIDEIEIKEDAESVRISRNGAAAGFAQSGYHVPQPTAQPAPQPAAAAPTVFYFSIISISCIRGHGSIMCFR